MISRIGVIITLSFAIYGCKANFPSRSNYQTAPEVNGFYLSSSTRYYGNGRVVTNTYELDERLNEITSSVPGMVTKFDEFGSSQGTTFRGKNNNIYTRNTAGNVTRIDVINDGVVTPCKEYFYKNNRVDHSIKRCAGTDAIRVKKYEYDLKGRVIRATHSGDLEMTCDFAYRKISKTSNIERVHTCVDNSDDKNQRMEQNTARLHIDQHGNVLEIFYDSLEKEVAGTIKAQQTVVRSSFRYQKTSRLVPNTVLMSIQLNPGRGILD